MLRICDLVMVNIMVHKFSLQISCLEINETIWTYFSIIIHVFGFPGV